MKKIDWTNASRLFFVILSLTFFVCQTATSAEHQSYRIRFLCKQVSIDFKSEKSSNGEGISAQITGFAKRKAIFVDFYEPEGDAIPKIKSVFIDGNKSKKLFIIVAWEADEPALDTGGSIYQVFVYDETIDKGGHQEQLLKDAALTKRFGVGFDGVREGHRITYKYKTAQAVRHQLFEWGYK